VRGDVGEDVPDLLRVGVDVDVGVDDGGGSCGQGGRPSEVGPWLAVSRVVHEVDEPVEALVDVGGPPEPTGGLQAGEAVEDAAQRPQRVGNSPGTMS
jgi:hypothetical protein